MRSEPFSSRSRWTRALAIPIVLAWLASPKAASAQGIERPQMQRRAEPEAPRARPEQHEMRAPPEPRAPEPDLPWKSTWERGRIGFELAWGAHRTPERHDAETSAMTALLAADIRLSSRWLLHMEMPAAVGAGATLGNPSLGARVVARPAPFFAVTGGLFVTPPIPDTHDTRTSRATQFAAFHVGGLEHPERFAGYAFGVRGILGAELHARHAALRAAVASIVLAPLRSRPSSSLVDPSDVRTGGPSTLNAVFVLIPSLEMEVRGEALGGGVHLERVVPFGHSEEEGRAGFGFGPFVRYEPTRRWPYVAARGQLVFAGDGYRGEWQNQSATCALETGVVF
jgi:hypothetical protein